MRRFEQAPVADFRDLQFLFRFASIANVVEDQYDAGNAACGVQHRSGAFVDGPLAAVPGNQNRVLPRAGRRAIAENFVMP